MKKILYAILISAAVLATSCSTEPDEVAETDGKGTVQLTVTTSTAVDAVTRAQVQLPATVIPNGDDFALRITATEPTYDQSWTSLRVFDSPRMQRGNYTAAISYGNMDIEGVNAACFSGSQAFTILSRRTITTDISASLQNAAFKVLFSEWFTNYYTQAQITIRTASGNQFTFTPTTESILFVKPGTELFLKGTANKSQTGTAVEFPEKSIGTTTARTLHTITVNASEAGGGTLNITLDESFTSIPEQEIELNDDAK
ncbi:MAG: DUF4493 domain-containing protein [Alistipes sp.]